MVAAVAAPPVLLLALLFRYGVDLPYWDEWILVEFFDRGRTGELRLVEFWNQHNEHRLFASRLVLYGLGLLTGWSVFAEYLLSFFLAVAGLLAALVVVRRLVPEGSARASAMVFSSLTLFSLGQWENWLWGWQAAVFLCSSAVLGAIALLSSARLAWRSTASAAVLAVLASLSYGSGLVVWPACLLALLLLVAPAGRSGLGKPGRGRWCRSMVVWLASGTVTFWLYFRSYWWGEPAASPYGLEGLQDYAVYVLSYLGSPFLGSLENGWPAAVAGALGVLVLAVLVVIELRARGSEGLAGARAAIALAAFGFGCALLTGLGRLSEGVGQALTSRYTTFGGLFWLGVVLWLHRILSHPSGLTETKTKTRLRPVAIAVLAAILAGHVVAAREGLEQFRVHQEIRGPSRAALVEGRFDEPRLVYVFPDRERLRAFVETASRLEVGIFREGAKDSAAVGEQGPRPASDN